MKTIDRHHPKRLAKMTAAILCAVLLCSGVFVALQGRTVAAPTLPAGFAIKDLPSGQSELLTDFSFAPDGSYFTTGKNGRVAWVPASGAARTLATLPVVTNQDLGLTTIAVARDYATSKKIYTARTLTANGQWTMRLSAWTVSGNPEPTGLTNEQTIIDLRAYSNVHAMTGLVVANDGTLWVSIGDSADFQIVDQGALRANDINQGYGKIIHIHPDGKGVASNPFYDAAQPSSWKSRVYASGFRSPFRLSLDPTTNTPITGDVGWNTYEEINLVRAGSHYGWPCWEGNGTTPGYRDLAGCTGIGTTKPLWTYVHGPLGTSVTGGVVYTGSTYPAAYQGAYFFGDYASGRVYTLKYNAQGTLTRQPEANGFGAENGAPVKFATTTNGDIVYADIIGSKLKRLVYAAGNRAPTAAATTSTNPTTRTVSFDASTSSDLDNDPLTYRWDFGDGSTGSGVKVSHTYAAPGTTPLTARLTVTDSLGATSTLNITVVPANNSPSLMLTTPPSGTLFKVSDPVRLSATATDAEDGPLTVNWKTTLVHCSGGYCHNHPGSPASGPQYEQAFEDHGDNTRLEITASASDRHGVVTQQTYIAQPKLRNLGITSNVPSAITINGAARQSSQVTVGAKVSLIAPALATDGVSTFERWSDGAAREREITMPDSDTNLVATYSTPIDKRYNSDTNVRALLGAPTGLEIGDNTLRYRDYSGGRLYWTPASGVHEVHGGIRGIYLANGGHDRFGEPTTDETKTADGRGRYNRFKGSPATIDASALWSPETGSHMVYGAIHELWESMGFERSPHGYPKSSELTTPNGRGRYNNFQNGGIYWTGQIGAKSVLGAIYAKWGEKGWEGGFLGFPLTNETTTPDGRGRYNHFEGGSVYWTPQTGAHEVHGSIRARWQALGWERSYLGYPTSDEFSIPGGKRTNFERGYITWNASNGQVIDRRY